MTGSSVFPGARLAPSPAARLLTMILLVVGLATAPLEPGGARAATLAITLGVLAIVRPPARSLLHRLAPGLCVILALVAPLLIAGRRDEATTLGTRATLALLAATTLSTTVSLMDLGGGLRALGVPAPLCLVVESMVRQLATLRAEAERLRLARQLRGARGFVPGADAIAALLVRTLWRAERAELARALRGYHLDRAPRHTRLRTRDLPVVLLAAVAGLAPHMVGAGA